MANGLFKIKHRKGPKVKRKKLAKLVRCDNCGKNCKVKFRPKGIKPVYCNKCFARIKKEDFKSGNKYNITMKNIYDVIIVGGGSAGLSAAIYCARRGLKTLVITVEIGGQCNLATHIENYPGYEPVMGVNLIGKFSKQAMGFGAEIKTGKVVSTGKTKSGFFTKTESGDRFEAKTLILAHGKAPIKMNIPGESKFLGKGVSTCAVCDGPLFKGKTIAIVGGSASAVESAEELSDIAKKVYLITPTPVLFAPKEQIEALKKKGVAILLNTSPKEVKGKGFVESFLITNNKSKKTQELKVNGIFVELGYIVDTSNVKGLVKLNKMNEILVDERARTSQEGVFAAGDVTSLPYKQVVISAGEGAKAGLEAFSYIKGGKAVLTDWGDR